MLGITIKQVDIRRKTLYRRNAILVCADNMAVRNSHLLHQAPDKPDAPGSYPEFYAGVDAVVMGWTTYHQIVTQLSPDSWPYEGRPCYVVTHRQEKGREGVCFWAGELAVLADKLKAECAETIWICGGASVAGQLLEEDRIDRLWLSVVPVVLGKGVRLFPELSQPLPLKLIETKSYNGIVDLIYERR